MDRRPEELRHIGIVVDFLCDEYPELFEKGEYTHPVLGECKFLKLRTLDIMQVDYARINTIIIDYLDNWVKIRTNTPDMEYTVYPLFKDKSVM